MTSEAPAKDAASVQTLFWWSLINLFLGIVAIIVTLWAFDRDRDLRAELVQMTTARTCPPKVIGADVPPIVENVPVPTPPQDQARSGYIGRSGTSIDAAMTLELEAVRESTPEAPTLQVRLGSQEVLPSRTIHVVNLWATWCKPCLEEMPDFKAMFARHPEWGDRVRFVPILLKDGAAPAAAYRDRNMPAAAYKLADRGYGDPLVAALSADEQHALFKGNLPVTFVLDCNRRVRWAQFDQLQGAQFKELEVYISRFVEEIDDTSPGAWCSQEWPGNGRCEGGEDTAKHHSLADCGPLKKVAATPDVLPPTDPPPVASDMCPEGEILPNGRCKSKLIGVTKTVNPQTPTLATCGNGVCDVREDSTSCCEDCPCEAPTVCRQAVDAGPKWCQLPGLREK